MEKRGIEPSQTLDKTKQIRNLLHIIKVLRTGNKKLLKKSQDYDDFFKNLPDFSNSAEVIDLKRYVQTVFSPKTHC